MFDLAIKGPNVGTLRLFARVDDGPVLLAHLPVDRGRRM